MRKVLEYSEFVSPAKSILDKLIRIEKKWMTGDEDDRNMWIEGSAEKNEYLFERYSEMIKELGKIIPLDCDDAEGEANLLSNFTLNTYISHTIYYLVRVLLSERDGIYNLVDMFPIKWITVK